MVNIFKQITKFKKARDKCMTSSYRGHDARSEAATRPTDLQKKHVGTIAERLFISINLLLKEHQVLPQDFKFEQQLIADEAHGYMKLNPARESAKKIGPEPRVDTSAEFEPTEHNLVSSLAGEL